jgi:iron-sulfur cluster assembly protein
MNPALDTVKIVTLTDSAVDEAKSLLAKEVGGDRKGLRVFIEAGGCSGMQYGMVFDERRDGDLVAEFRGVAVLVDSVSAEYLRGTVVDFVDSLTNGGFKISNPNARQSCGCGKSFEA